MATREQKKKQQSMITKKVSTPVYSELPNYTGGATMQKIPNYTGGATLQNLPNVVQTAPGYGTAVQNSSQIEPSILQGALASQAGTGGKSYYYKTGKSTGGSGSAGGSYSGSDSYGGDSGRPTYTPKYQTYIDDLLGQTANYGEYQSPYADRIEAALSGVENYGPYVSPYQHQLDDALAGIQDYGPYQSQYADQIAAQLNAIQNRDPFSYDYESDPVWQAYKQQYMREGRRASEDAMGQYAAMTGGMPSTAAMAAAQQAQSYYNAQMNDKIPELYKLAYDMWLNEGNQMQNNLSTLQGLDQTDYGRWADAYNRMLNGYDALRAADQTAYGRYGDDYSRMLQNLSTLHGMDESQYGRWQDAYNRMLTNMDAYRTMENDAYGRYRDTVGDWENDRNFQYQKDLDAWDQAYKERAYEDSRADTDWEHAYQERAYSDSRADTEYSRNKNEEANTIYAYSSTGGEPYTISSGKGLSFVTSAMPGDSMTGGDGSIWTKNTDGSITITRGGETWKISVPEVTTGGYRGGGGGGGGGGGSKIDLSTDIGKEVATIPGAISSYLSRWDDMDSETKYMALVTSGIDPTDALRMSSGGTDDDRWHVQQALEAIMPSTPVEKTKPTLTAAQAAAAIEDGIYTEQVLNAYEYYYGVRPTVTSGGNGNGTVRSNLTSLDYSPEEGTFTWNGKTYGSAAALAGAIDSAGLTAAEEEKLRRSLSAYGFDMY